MKIGEPYKATIEEIIKNEKQPEVIVHKLKIYMLENIEYFNSLIPGLDVGWLAKEIYLQNKNRMNYGR
jgi:hypothetical protein